ncbi:MAG TPA: hypothetical protein VGM39_25215, partial [Kofleriaceae bacterium]
MGLSLWSTAALADKIVVRFAPDPSAPDEGTLLPNRRFPAGTAFTVEYATPNSLATASLELWPPSSAENCASSKLSKQHYKFAMTPQGTGADRTLQAEIPPLQIGIAFCYELKPSVPITSEDAEALAKAISQGYVDKLESFDLTSADSLPLAKQAANDSIEPSYERIKKNLGAAGERLVGQLKIGEITSILAVSSEVDDYLEARIQLKATQDALQGQKTDETSAAITKVQKDVTEKRDKVSNLVQATTKTMLGGAVNSSLTLSLSSTTTGTETAPVGTFVSPEFGIAVATPLAGPSHDPWMMPFFGVNLYLARVDREIPITSLIGGPYWQKFRQIFSVTV